MTQTLAEPASPVGDAASPPVTAPGPRRPLVVVTLVVVFIAAAAGWAWTSAAARGAVSVELGGQAECSGTVEHARALHGVNASLIVTRKGMLCTLPVTIHNGSRFATTVDTFTVSYLGAGDGWGTQVLELDGIATASTSTSANRIDAVFDVGEEIAAGESYRVDVPITFAPRGCSSPGTLTWNDHPVVVQVSSLGFSGPREMTFRLAFRGTDDTSCDGTF